MKKSDPLKKNKKNNTRLPSPDFTSPDIDSDKTGPDKDADKTVKKNKLNKSKLEINPDSTGGDTKADKTKKETFPDQPKSNKNKS